MTTSSVNSSISSSSNSSYHRFVNSPDMTVKVAGLSKPLRAQCSGSME